MSNHKKRSKRAENKTQAEKEIAAAAPSQTVEPVVTLTRQEEPGKPVHRSGERAAGEGGRSNLLVFGSLLLSAITLVTVVMLSRNLSEKLQQKASMEQVDKLTSQVSRLTVRLEESLRNNQQAIDASLKVSRLDQRAWVGVKSIQMFPMEAGKPLKMEIKYSNSGKTFALDVRHTGILRLTDKPLGDVAPEDRENLDKQPKQVPTLVTLAPNGESLIPCASLAPITEEMIAAINSGKVHVYLVGEISYTDVFKQWHTTRFFQKYVPAEQKFMAEQSHNDAD